jgi:hypothetical protein
MKQTYKVGTVTNVDAALRGDCMGGGGNQPHTAVAQARNAGFWLDPATLLEHGCPHTRRAQALEGAERMLYEHTNSFALTQEAEALRFSRGLEQWAASDPAPTPPDTRAVEARARWIAARARELRLENERALDAHFCELAEEQWNAAHTVTPASKKTSKGKPAHAQ